VIPLKEIELRTSRSSGPGGQHANVTASRVEATFDVERSESLPEDVRDGCSRRSAARQCRCPGERSQHRNRAIALERLGRASPTPVRAAAAPTDPSWSWRA